MSEGEAEFWSIDRASLSGERRERLKGLLRAIRDRCGASEATFWSISSDGELLRGALNVGASEETMESLDVPIDDTLVGMVAMTGIAACHGPDAEYHEGADEATRTATRAMIAAPVHAHGVLCGVLSAINPREGSEFSGDQLSGLQQGAGELAGPLEETAPGE